MNRSVPTLLGIVIILLVVVLVVLIYNYRLTSGLAAGGTVVGTAGQRLLTGVEPPEEEIGVGEVLERRGETAPRTAPPPRSAEPERAVRYREGVEQREQRRAAGRQEARPETALPAAEPGE